MLTGDLLISPGHSGKVAGDCEASEQFNLQLGGTLGGSSPRQPHMLRLYPAAFAEEHGQVLDCTRSEEEAFLHS